MDQVEVEVVGLQAAQRVFDRGHDRSAPTAPGWPDQGRCRLHLPPVRDIRPTVSPAIDWYMRLPAKIYAQRERCRLHARGPADANGRGARAGAGSVRAACWAARLSSAGAPALTTVVMGRASS